MSSQTSAGPHAAQRKAVWHAASAHVFEPNDERPSPDCRADEIKVSFDASPGSLVAGGASAAIGLVDRPPQLAVRRRKRTVADTRIMHSVARTPRAVPEKTRDPRSGYPAARRGLPASYQPAARATRVVTRRVTPVRRMPPYRKERWPAPVNGGKTSACFFVVVFRSPRLSSPSSRAPRRPPRRRPLHRHRALHRRKRTRRCRPRKKPRRRTSCR